MGRFLLLGVLVILFTVPQGFASVAVNHVSGAEGVLDDVKAISWVEEAGGALLVLEPLDARVPTRAIANPNGNDRAEWFVDVRDAVAVVEGAVPLVVGTRAFPFGSSIQVALLLTYLLPNGGIREEVLLTANDIDSLSVIGSPRLVITGIQYDANGPHGFVLTRNAFDSFDMTRLSEDIRAIRIASADEHIIIATQTHEGDIKTYGLTQTHELSLLGHIPRAPIGNLDIALRPDQSVLIAAGGAVTSMNQTGGIEWETHFATSTSRTRIAPTPTGALVATQTRDHGPIETYEVTAAGAPLCKRTPPGLDQTFDVSQRKTIAIITTTPTRPTIGTLQYDELECATAASFI